MTTRRKAALFGEANPAWRGGVSRGPTVTLRVGGEARMELAGFLESHFEDRDMPRAVEALYERLDTGGDDEDQLAEASGPLDFSKGDLDILVEAIEGRYGGAPERDPDGHVTHTRTTADPTTVHIYEQLVSARDKLDKPAKALEPRDIVRGLAALHPDGAVKAGGAGNAQALIDWFNEGADGQIDWGTEGDFDACVRIAGEHMDEEQARGFCALRHEDAVGERPGGHKEAASMTTTRRRTGTRGKAADPSRPGFDPTKLPGFETKDLPVAGVKVLDQEQGIVECYVAGIGNKDDGGDIIEPGFFEKSLAKGIKPKGVWAHDWKVWVAKCLDTYEVKAGDPRLRETKLAKAKAGGQYVKAQFNMDTQPGREAFSNVRFFGDECEWSIGYVATEAPTDEKGRHLIDGEWYEFSPVLFGMNRATSTLGAKGLDALGDADTLNDALDAIGELLDGEPGGEALVAKLRGLADAGQPQVKGMAAHSHDDSPENISDHLESQHGIAKADQPDGPVPSHALHEQEHDGDIAQQYEPDDDEVEEKPRRKRAGMKNLPEGETRIPEGKLIAPRDHAHKVRVTVAGSYEAVQEDLCHALREWALMQWGMRSNSAYINLEATFDDALIFGVTDWEGSLPYVNGYGAGSDHPRFYRMDWRMEGGDIVLGTAVEVDVSAVLEDDEPEPMTALATASLERLAAARAAKLDEVKVGARHSKADTEMLQGIHDAACTLGAKCAMETEEKGSEAPSGQGAASREPQTPEAKDEQPQETPEGAVPQGEPAKRVFVDPFETQLAEMEELAEAAGVTE